MTRIAPKIAFAAALAVFGTAAQAADFVFGTKVAGDGAGTVNFASLTITQNGANVDFFLNAYGLEAFGPGAFLNSILFTEASIAPGFGACCSPVVGGTVVSIAAGGGPGFPGSDTGLSRFSLTDGEARLTDGETVSWTWENLVFAGVPTLAANVQGISLEDSQTGSGVYVPADFAVPGIPEPGTYALMLGGLGVLGFLARRRRT